MPGFAALKSDWFGGVLTFLKRSDNTKVIAISPLAGVGRFVTREDQDAQNATMLVATLNNGFLVHTSASAGGTLTLDTGSNLDTAYPEWQTGEVRSYFYLNDGNQTVTLTGATGTTALSAQTIATLQGRVIRILKTAATTYLAWAD